MSFRKFSNGEVIQTATEDNVNAQRKSDQTYQQVHAQREVLRQDEDTVLPEDVDQQ